MDVFLMIRRKNLTIFLDAKETTTVIEIKRMIEGITKRKPDDLMLIKDETSMHNEKMLADYNLNINTAKAQMPASLGLCFRDNGQFEPLEITPLSVPPELPDSMKPSEPEGIQPSG